MARCPIRVRSAFLPGQGGLRQVGDVTSSPISRASLRLRTASGPAFATFAQDCVNRVNLVPKPDSSAGFWWEYARRREPESGGGKPVAPKAKWGPALLPAPTVAAAGTLAFQRLSSPRPSAVPCPSVPVLSNGLPPVRFAVRSRLQAGASLSAQPSVLRRPQFLTTWAWQSLVPVPRSARCRASCRCERVSLRSSSGAAPVSPALRPHLRTVPPGGRQGPFRAAWRAAPRSVSAGACPRSCDHRPCRFHCASGRHSGLRSQPFRFAIRRFQSAPQHAESGFIAYFPV